MKKLKTFVSVLRLIQDHVALLEQKELRLGVKTHLEKAHKIFVKANREKEVDNAIEALGHITESEGKDILKRDLDVLNKAKDRIWAIKGIYTKEML